MFTGLTEEIGRVRRVSRKGRGMSLRIAGEKVLEEAKPGDSISVDGVCLTITRVGPEGFEAWVGEETLKRTKFSSLKPSAPVNLERPLRASDRLGGHLVQGHVDGVGRVKSKRRSGTSLLLEISFPNNLSQNIVEKGSIALNGVSLTVSSLRGLVLSISVIPYTLNNTTLGKLRVGDPVNIEADVIGKYLRKEENERA